MNKLFWAFAVACVALSANAEISNSQILISELEPDESNTQVELFGTPGSAFDLFLVFLENDGTNDGFVDSVHNVSGNFDINGLAVTSLTSTQEGPSFTLILSDSNPETVVGNTDLDADDDGIIDDTAGFGQIFDSVGISDEFDDNGGLYSNSLGGSSILSVVPSGSTATLDPDLVFREESSGQFFQFFADNPNTVFAADGNTQFDVSDFDSDPTSPTFGSINPRLVAVPEPSSVVILVLLTVGLGVSRVRKQF